MTTAEFEEAIGLTLFGVGTAFAALVILMAIVVLTGWSLRRQWVQRRLLGPAAEAARDKALAASIGVGVALAQTQQSDEEPSE